MHQPDDVKFATTQLATGVSLHYAERGDPDVSASTTIVAANTNNIAPLVRAFIRWTSFPGFLNFSKEEQHRSDPQQVEQGDEEADVEAERLEGHV
jgi:hypothetical protein